MNHRNNCSKYREDIAALVLGLLEQEEAEKLQKHIETCQNCKAFYEDMLNEEKNIQTVFTEIAQKGEAIQNSLLEKLDKNESISITSQKIIKKNWSNILRNPLIKFAAAAIIILGIGLLFHKGLVTFTTPAFGLENVINAVKEVPWIHCTMKIEQIHGDVNEINKSVGDGWESWESSNPSLHIEKHSDGKIFFTENDTMKISTYYPETNTITIEQKTQSASQETYSGSAPEIFIKQIADLEKKGAKVIQREDTYLGKPVKIIDLDITPEGGSHNIITIMVDAETYFPKKLTWQENNLKSGYGGKMVGLFDSPANGPKDIYEAGAPRDAKIIQIKASNNRDNPNFFESLKPYNEARRSLVSDYILITAYLYDTSIRTIVVTYNQGQRQRSEYHPVWGSVVNNEDLIAYKKALGDSFDSMLKWSQDYSNSKGKNLGIHIYDGQYYYSVEKDPLEKWNIPKKQLWPDLNPIGLDDLSDWGWPVIQAKDNVKQIENKFSIRNNLIAFEKITEPVYSSGKLISPAQKEIYYLDPSHDYMCVQKETYQHPKEIGNDFKYDESDPDKVLSELLTVRIITEFGKTDNGQLYPKEIEKYSKIQGRSEFISLYLKTNPEFPEGIFDPNNLPK